MKINQYCLGEAHLEICDNGEHIIHIYPESCNGGERGLCHFLKRHIIDYGQKPGILIHIEDNNEPKISND